MKSAAITCLAPASGSAASIGVSSRCDGRLESLEEASMRASNEQRSRSSAAVWRLRQCLPMIGASFCFALLGAIAKEASAVYDAYEIVFYRSLACTLWAWAELRLSGHTLRTSMPMEHATRSATGAVAMLLWFGALGGLPMATAVTLNLTSSVWMAGFAVCGGLLLGRGKIQPQLLGAVLFGFGGIALMLQPSIGRGQFWFGAAAAASGLLTAIASVTISALGRAGEPVSRIFFYSSVGPAVAGAALAAMRSGFHEHTARSLAVLLALGIAASLSQTLKTRAFCTSATLLNAALQYLSIVFSFCAGVWLFGEPVTLSAISGMFLVVLAGVAAALAGERLPSPAAREGGPSESGQEGAACGLPQDVLGRHRHRLTTDLGLKNSVVES